MEIEQLSNLQLSSIKGGEWIYIAGEWYWIDIAGYDPETNEVLFTQYDKRIAELNLLNYSDDDNSYVQRIETVYEFVYDSDCYECGVITQSIHKTRKGAEMAMEFHKNKIKQEYEDEREWDKNNNDFNPEYYDKYTWDWNQSWFIRETKLEN